LDAETRRQPVVPDDAAVSSASARRLAQRVRGDGGATAGANAVNPVVPISWGELLDRVTILEIKVERLAGAAARNNVEQELALLSATADAALRDPVVAGLKTKLKKLNEALWTIEDEIRGHEAQQLFDTEFIRLAR